ncbi:hypothetical protein BCR39DRAFT_493143 [Naematelia encephala]|uniref:Actin cortical patch SUR7/pH-response regulator pali n=1 Tax=Naematelia encephala TaxID=71784 RepID=A0A1Y2BBH8_9TREE|nr:hypothetical protein BCR39DRAFT_493143 [Naematelia encephala]
MFRYYDCLEAHILIGLISSSSATILLFLTSFSAPYINSIYFLLTPSPDNLRLGGFGYCSLKSCTTSMIGYDVGPEMIQWLTRTHILFPLAAIFMSIALIFLILSLLKTGRFMWNPIYFRTTALFGSIIAIIAEIFALVNWVQARHKYDDHQGQRARYGSALWLGLVGAITAFLSVCIGGPAFEGSVMYRHTGTAYNV